DAHIFQGLVIAHPVANFPTVDIGQHDVEHDEVGTVLLHHHAGIETGSCHAYFEAPVLLQDLGHELDQLDIVVDEQDLPLAAFQGIGRNAIVLHELVKRLAWDAPEPRTGYPESLELSVVETTNDGLLTDLADFGGLAGRKNSFHAFFYP